MSARETPGNTPPSNASVRELRRRLREQLERARALEQRVAVQHASLLVLERVYGALDDPRELSVRLGALLEESLREAGFRSGLLYLADDDRLLRLQLDAGAARLSAEAATCFAHPALLWDVIHDDDVRVVHEDDPRGGEAADLLHRMRRRAAALAPFRSLGGAPGVLVLGLDHPLGPDDPRREFARSLADALGRAVSLGRVVQELAISERRYRAIFEAAPFGMASMGPDLRVIRVNRVFEQLSGYPREELLRMSLPALVHADDRAENTRLCLEMIEGGSDRFEMQSRVERKDGRTVWVRQTASPVRDASGHFEKVISVFEDITERQQLEEQLRQSQKMDAVGQLAGGIAHDFNNLLTAILGYTSLIEMSLDDRPDVLEKVKQIERAGERATALIRQLLVFSRRQVLVPELVDVGHVVEQLVGMLRPMIGENIALVTLVAPDLPKVRADRGQLEQVIVNLAVNARDAMPGGGKLIVEVTAMDLDQHYADQHHEVKPGSYVMLAITDNGVGMSAETQSRAFEPFFTTKEKGKGTGLGLATVYGIVKQSGGHVWLYSEPSHGTTFKIYLPATDETGALTASERALRPVPRGTETVLVVEDDDVVRRLAHEILEASGYSVLRARSGAEALELAAHHPTPIHLLLTDMVMPGLSGQVIAARLAVDHPDMRVLYMSGYTGGTVLDRGALPAGTGFLQKPFTPGALARAVRAALDEPEP